MEEAGGALLPVQMEEGGTAPQFKWRKGGTALQRAPLEKQFSCPQGVQALRERTEPRCPPGTQHLGTTYPRGLPRVLGLEGKGTGWQPLATPCRFLQSKPRLRAVLRISHLPAGLQSPREKPSCVGWKTVSPLEARLQPHGDYGGGGP